MRSPGSGDETVVKRYVLLIFLGALHDTVFLLGFGRIVCGMKRMLWLFLVEFGDF